jgi:hypothetical protein
MAAGRSDQGLLRLARGRSFRKLPRAPGILSRAVREMAENGELPNHVMGVGNIPGNPRHPGADTITERSFSASGLTTRP